MAALRSALLGGTLAVAAAFGAPATLAEGATAQALAVPPGVIVFSHEDSGSSNYQQQYDNLYRMDAQNPATRTKLTSFTFPLTLAETLAWSRDYSQLAFTTDFNNGLPSLEPDSAFAMNPDGSNLRPITGFGLIHPLPPGTGVVTGVVQAPSGGQITACQITVQGSTNSTPCQSGGGAFTLTGVPPPSAWVRVGADVFYTATNSSPPGGSLGFAAIQFNANGVANVGTIVPEPQFSSSIAPSWSPDGTQVLTTWLTTGEHIQCTTICSWAPNQPTFQLNVWSADGKTVRGIPNPPPLQYAGADWSPVQADNRICIAAVGPGSGQSYIVVFVPAGGNASAIYTVPSPLVTGLNSKVTGCRWSPDGQRVAFTQLNGNVFGAWWSDLYVINAADRTLKQLTQNTPGILSDMPAWSPDATALAYQTAVNPGFPNPVTQTSVDLYAIDPGTLGVTQLTSDHRSSNPAWAPVAAPPNPPTNVVALAGDGSATVVWEPPLLTGGPATKSHTGTAIAIPAAGPIASYTVTSSPGGLTSNADGTATSATVTGLTTATSYPFTVTATSFAGGTSAPSPPSNAVVPGRGQFQSLPPFRVLDTRSGLGAPQAPLGQGASLDVQITGQGGVPSSGVAAVVLNVTVTGTTAGSYLTVWPAGVPRPLASNLNWTPGRTVPNLVEVAVGLGGKVSIFNAAGRTDVLFDVAGYVATPVEPPGADGLYTPVVPQRVLDTRDGTGGVPVGAVGPGGIVRVQVNGQAGLPATGVAAVVLNVTVTGPTQPSYVTVFPTGGAHPNASNLNFVVGQTVPNRVIVKVGANGTPGWVSFFNAAGSTQIIADIGGWFSDGTAAATGSRFVGGTPPRILDTRDGTGGFHAPLGQGQKIAATVAGVGGVPAMNATVAPSAVVLNVTVTDTTASSYLTAWPDGATQPNASDLNWVTGLTVPNLVVVKVGPNGKIDLFNPAGSANVIIDVVGWYG